jgi:hypothetical protein
MTVERSSAFKALKARHIPAWGGRGPRRAFFARWVQVAPGKYQAKGPSSLPESGVQRETRNDGIAFFGRSETIPQPRIQP